MHSDIIFTCRRGLSGPAPTFQASDCTFGDLAECGALCAGTIPKEYSIQSLRFLESLPLQRLPLLPGSLCPHTSQEEHLCACICTHCRASHLLFHSTQLCLGSLQFQSCTGRPAWMLLQAALILGKMQFRQHQACSRQVIDYNLGERNSRLCSRLCKEVQVVTRIRFRTGQQSNHSADVS
jgi:hypothetical protein